MSNIVKWEPQPDGTVVWCTDDRVLGRVYADNSGFWHPEWFGYRGTTKWEPFHDNYGQSHRSWFEYPLRSQRLSDAFLSISGACLAMEKHWPPSDRYHPEWFESVSGSFYRQFAKHRVYVRADEDGWYAVRQDGRVLGKAGKDMRFSNYLDTMAAVEQEVHMPVDADPFRDKSNDWCWIKMKGVARAA